MAGSVFDSALYAGLFPVGDAGRLFSDSAELRAMLLVEGALAKAQGARGIIPELSAAAISRAVMEVQIDPAALSAPTGANGVSVPGLIAAFRAEMNAPEHAQFVHWGATSQDILDTGLMLRLRQAQGILARDLAPVLRDLARLARDHAELPMPARTYGQHATPTSFGAVAASWGTPLIGTLDRDVSDWFWVSLSGAAGTASALGPHAPALRADLASALGLHDPRRSWHTDRSAVLQIAHWAQQITRALAKMGADLTDLVQTGIAEIRLDGAGASSTMPQKQNPVAPSVLMALAQQGEGLLQTLGAASVHRHQRDGAAWFTEWMCVPQIMLGTAAAVQTAQSLTAGLRPDAANMTAALNGGLGMIHAEALSFALAARMPRPEAQAAVKALCLQAQQSQTSLSELVAAAYPDLDTPPLFDPRHQMGHAPDDARAFAAAAQQLLDR